MTAAFSIRTKLTRSVLGMVILAWLATILLALVFLDYETNEMLDEELEGLTSTVVMSIDTGAGGVIPRIISIEPGDSERVLRIFPVDQPAPPGPWPALDKDGFHQIDGWRVLRTTAERAVIEVAHNMSWRREEILEAASAFLVLILPLAGVLLVLIGRQLRKGFRPMEKLAEEISARSPAMLDPVATEGLPQELQPLVTAMNTHLARIEALRQSERTFIANASHELRTPLAAIRAGLELSPDPEARAALPRIDALARRVERLLQLSRSQSGLGLGRGPADLLQILRLLQRDPAPAGRAAFRLDDGDLEAFPLDLDPDALAIVLRNLIENAQEHGTGPVWVRLSPEGLQISNQMVSGEFLTAPFAKRSGSAGMGLGLSIVAQLCAAMDIQISTQTTQDHLVVTLRFNKPSQPAQAPEKAGDPTLRPHP